MNISELTVDKLISVKSLNLLLDSDVYEYLF